MRKPVFPRILLFIALYFVVFTVLVSIQFAKQGSFTQTVGGFVISGQQRLPGADEEHAGHNEFLLEGAAHVFFGGIDFSMASGTEGQSLMLARRDGTKEEAVPERMAVSGESVVFTFPGGAELEFSSQYSGGSLLMLISGVFRGDVVGVEMPFKPLRKAVVKDADGQFTVSSNGMEYTFDRSPMDAEARMLFIMAGGAPVTYRAVPERKEFSPNDFILAQAQNSAAYNEAITRWRDHNFSAWSRMISDHTEEDVVIAFAGEALVRGTYKAAIAAVPSSFVRSHHRSFESSAYIGGLDQASRSLNSREREKITRLSRLINERSLDFLKEPRVIEYFAVRGQFNFIDTGADLVRAIDPALLALDITPGILEGFLDWRRYRPNAENPFERMVDQACFVVSESLRKTTDEAGSRVFVSTGGRADTEFNLRLGKALLEYAETANNNDWIGIGRSLILSALSENDVSSAKLFRILNPIESYPRGMPVIASSHMWAWTTAQAVSATQDSDALDIVVRFPAGETHYMMIRGVRPFSRIQLYGIDFRTDPQFERYDSSGWAYSSQDQTLLLKMRHRETNERVRVIFRESPRPEAPPPPQAETAEPAHAAESQGH